MPNKNSENGLEMLVEQTNDLLRKQLIIQLAMQGMPQQTIRKVLKCDMKLITEMLKPLKGKIKSNEKE
jgi:hypothetical protein